MFGAVFTNKKSNQFTAGLTFTLAQVEGLGSAKIGVEIDFTSDLLSKLKTKWEAVKAKYFTSDKKDNKVKLSFDKELAAYEDITKLKTEVEAYTVDNAQIERKKSTQLSGDEIWLQKNLGN